MSDAFEKVSGIRQLPVFPLPLVLLPDELLPLHIFEDKYRKMLVDVTGEQNMFGITLFEPGQGFADRPAAGSVGCVAEVRDVQSLPDGRSNIVVSGVIRYRLLEYVETVEPYLVAEVEFFEDDAEAETEVGPLAEEVFRIFERVAKAAFKLSGSRGQFSEIRRTAPEPFSFLATAAFNFENDLKYRLLEMTSTIARLEKLKEILLKTVGQMEASAELHEVVQKNGHSKRKIDM